MNHKVSVIVPVWNTEDYLRPCLDSIINQTLKDIEILVVDDGSPDNSKDIIKEYVSKYPDKVKGFYKENGGQGSARNLGLDYADGQYISFVDSDDYIDEKMLEEMYNQAITTDSDIVICDMEDIYPDGKTLYYNCTKYNNVHEVTPSACNKLFKRDVIKNIRFLGKRWYEDFNFTAKILFGNPKISVISKPFYICNSRVVSTMNNNNSIKNLDMLFVLEDLRNYLNENNLYDENMFSFLIFHHALITTINRVAKQKSNDRSEVLKQLNKYCHENISTYKKQQFYKNISKNRKIIAWLNYHGLYDFSKLLLDLKSSLKGEL